MGQYNFDQILDRTHTKSLKYDFAVKRGKPADVLPFWVADMDFEIPSELKQILLDRVNHGVFGYTESDDEYFEVLQNWFTTRFNWTPDRKWLVKTPGIVFALAMAVRAFTKEGEGVLINQPVYYPFSMVIDDNDRRLINVPLIKGEEKYTIDFEGIERAIVEENVTLFLLCNPHNPVGRVWTEDELKRLGDICIKHNVLIVSDEIHADFVWKGHTHKVFADLGESYAEHCIVCTAPSKTFNLAGLQVSNIIIPNDKLRKKFRKQISAAGYSQVNALGLVACESAYRNGRQWLDSLKEYLIENLNFVRVYLEENIPSVKLIEPEGTYLIWLDFGELGLENEELEDLIINKSGLWLDSGAIFGEDGKGYQRINIACPRKTLEQALNQLKSGIDSLK